MMVYDDYILVNFFFVGNFVLVYDEVYVDCFEVIGEFLCDLYGMFLCMGLNLQFELGERYYWFDGDGMFYGVYFEDGVVLYCNCWVCIVGFSYECDVGKKLWSGFGEMLQFESLLYGLLCKNVVNMVLVYYDGSLLVFWEVGELYEILFFDFEIVGFKIWNGQFFCFFIVYLKVDCVMGEMFFFGYNLMGFDYL